MSSAKPVNSPPTSTVPPKKRRNASIAEIGESSGNTSSPLQQPNQDDDEPVSKRGRQQLNQESSTAPPSAPVMALPPPLLSYPPHHPHQLAVVQSPYYHPLYHAGPFYLPVGSPPQPSMPPQSPLPSRQRSGSNTTRILPKLSSAAESTSEQTCFASPPLHASSPADYHPVYHPFALPITAASAASPSSVSGRDRSSTADQREQARKLSHSAIERRRRERINDKIVQLRQLIPSCANQEHLHKMTVLQSAIDYITYLKEVVSRLDGEDRVHVDLKMAKVPRSMVPKEVEAFTTQFSVNNKTNKSSDRDGRNRRRSSNDETLSNTSIATLPQEHQQQLPKDAQNDGRASSEVEEMCNLLEHPSSQKNLEMFDGQKGIKPIDIIKAGASTNNKLVATPIPSPLSLHQQDWTPSSLPSPMYRPVEHASNSSIASSPIVSPAGSPSHSWNEDQHSSLPTPTLTPRPTTEPHSTKHMSLNNILC